ncbi:MAG: FAD-linked oxidase C-terminal domain-containing protein [Acidobacteriota bacterium]
MAASSHPAAPTAPADRATADNDFAAVDPAHLEALGAIVGAEHLLVDDAARDRYGRDETERLCFPPAAIVRPADTDQVARILALAHDARLPVTPRGAGTGLSGGALPVHGGLVLTVERLDRIRAIDTRDLVAVAESGVVVGNLQRAVEAEGLFYPPDPGSKDMSLLGGNLAENAAGPRSCKYGATGAWVLGLEAVLADGRRIDTGGRNRKDVAGYDLARLLIGSEGTLAVITAATLRLIGRPAATLTLLLPFPDLESAAAAVEAIFRAGHDPAACELMEENALDAVGAVMELPPQLRGHRAVMLLELHAGAALRKEAGDDPSDELLERAAAIAALAEELGAGEAIAAEDIADQERLWAIRRKTGEAVKHRSVYKEADAVVPRSKLAELVRAARAVAAAHGLEAICYGHAGDGNLHVNLLRGSLDDDAWEARRDAAEQELFERVVALGGSVTGEHGIGYSQRAYLPLVRSPAALEVMRAIKRSFDPRGILNPGKIFTDG